MIATEPDPRQLSGEAPGKLSLLAKIGYGSGDFAFNLFWAGAGLFLLYFYTDVMGLPPALAGLVYFLAMVFDAVTDPLMGVLADRTRTRHGQYRPYLLYGAVPLALAYPLAYWAPSGWSVWQLFALALVTHCLYRGAYTVLSIPYSSLQARMSADLNERSAIAGWRMAFAALGTLATAIAMPIAVKSFGAGDERVGFFLAAAAIGVIGVIVFWICFAATREMASAPLPCDGPAMQTSTWISDLAGVPKLFLSNPPLMMLFAVSVIQAVSMSMFQKNLLYFFKYDVGDESLVTPALTVAALSALFGFPVWVIVSGKIGKRNTWLVGGAVASLGLIGFFLNTSHHPPTLFALIGLFYFGAASFAVMGWAMLPDTVEYREAKTGQRDEAKIFGFASFAQKAALGLNALLLGVLLERVGFIANTQLSNAALSGIKSIMTFIPLAGIALGALCLARYPITASYHKALRQEIDARRRAALEGPST